MDGKSARVVRGVGHRELPEGHMPMVAAGLSLGASGFETLQPHLRGGYRCAATAAVIGSFSTPTIWASAGAKPENTPAAGLEYPPASEPASTAFRIAAAIAG